MIGTRYIIIVFLLVAAFAFFAGCTGTQDIAKSTGIPDNQSAKALPEGGSPPTGTPPADPPREG